MYFLKEKKKFFFFPLYNLATFTLSSFMFFKKSWLTLFIFLLKEKLISVLVTLEEKFSFGEISAENRAI